LHDKKIHYYHKPKIFFKTSNVLDTIVDAIMIILSPSIVKGKLTSGIPRVFINFF
jgi:hypothetical protein